MHIRSFVKIKSSRNGGFMDGYGGVYGGGYGMMGHGGYGHGGGMMMRGYGK